MRNITTQLLAERDWLAGLAHRLVADAAAADDLVQETWLKALTSPPERLDHPRGWLATVLRSVHLQRARSEGRRAQRERDSARAEATGDVTEVLQRAELEQRVAETVAGLPGEQREAIVLRYREGWSVQRIASRTGVNASTVRSRLHRGLEQARERLAERHPDDRRAWALALIPLARRADRSLVSAASAGGPLIWTLAAALVCAVGALVWILGPKPEDGHGSQRLAARWTAGDGQAGVELESTLLEPVERLAADPPGGVRTLQVVGRIVDSGGRPLAARAIEVHVGRTGYPCETGEDGRFALEVEWTEDPRPRSCAFTIVDPRLEHFITFAEAITDDRIDLGTHRLERRGAVRIRYGASLSEGQSLLGVLTEPDAEPLPTNPACPPVATWHYAVDDGHAVIRGVEPGSYRLWTRGGSNRWSTVPLEVELDRITEVSVPAVPAAEDEILALELVDPEGRPVAAAACTVTVQARYGFVRERHTTDIHGRIDLLFAAVGDLDLVVGGSNRRFANTRVQLDGSAEEPVRIVVRPWRVIDVLVLDAVGRTVEDASVMIWPQTSTDESWLEKYSSLAQESGSDLLETGRPGVYRGEPLARPFHVRVSVPLAGQPNWYTHAGSFPVDDPERLGDRMRIDLSVEVEPSVGTAASGPAEGELWTLTGRAEPSGASVRFSELVALVEGDRVLDAVRTDAFGAFWLSASVAHRPRLLRLPYPVERGFEAEGAVARLAEDPRFGSDFVDARSGVVLPAAGLATVTGTLRSPEDRADWTLELEPELEARIVDEVRWNTRHPIALDASGGFQHAFVPLDRTVLRLTRAARIPDESPIVLEAELELAIGEERTLELTPLLVDVEVSFPVGYTALESFLWKAVDPSGLAREGEWAGPIEAGEVRTLRDVPAGRLVTGRQRELGARTVRVDGGEPVTIVDGAVVQAP